MNRRRGIAIISVLLIMLAVFTLGMGALFLSRLNLRMSENVRSNSIVQYNANSGLDAAMVALEAYYLENDEFPQGETVPGILASLSLVAQGPDPVFTISAYKSFGADRARVEATSTLANGAEHVADLLVEIGFDTNSDGDSAPDGLVSMGVVKVNGNSTYYDGGVHGNLGYDLGNDTFFACAVRNSDNGTCEEWVETPLVCPPDHPSGCTEGTPLAPISSTGDWVVCKPDTPQNSMCDDDGAPLSRVDPIVVEPDYVGKRDGVIDELAQVLADAGRTGEVSNVFEFCEGPQGVRNGDNECVDTDGDPVTLSAMYCDEVLANPSSSEFKDAVLALQTGDSPIAVPTICIDTGGLDLTGEVDLVLNNVNIVAQGSIDLPNSVTIDNSTMISTTGGVLDGITTSRTINVDLNNSRIFSQNSIDAQGTGSEYRGISTIATAGDILINGGAPNPIVGEDGLEIGLVLLADGKIEIKGSGTWYAVAVAGGNKDANGNYDCGNPESNSFPRKADAGYTQDGTVTLIGGVKSVCSILMDGGIVLDSSLGVNNPIFEEDPTPVVTVISRR